MAKRQGRRRQGPVDDALGVTLGVMPVVSVMHDVGDGVPQLQRLQLRRKCEGLGGEG